jgi:RNA-directed DNA polymerase
MTGNQRLRRRAAGLATYRLVRFADDFVVLVSGTQAHTEALRSEVATVLIPMGLRLSESKTKISHIDEGFDFLFCGAGAITSGTGCPQPPSAT